MQSDKIHLLPAICLVIATVTALPVKGQDSAKISGELKKWHKVTLTFTGPDTSEKAQPNPFLDYRLNVIFRKGKKQYIVPGYYAADGNAGQTSATDGNKWHAHFVPDEIGQWSYTASFRTGKNIALSNIPGSSTAFDGAYGNFNISATDKKGRDHRGKGMLRYVGKRYLLFAETGEFFLKGGADSPENFLGYADFDNTYDSGELKRSGEAAGAKFIHHYKPHIKDWKQGDPTWKNGKGKGMIGALNYLASKGMNSVYFIPYNIDGGDGKDVWPWIEPDEKFRFDCSKLDQWEIVFSHMDKLGLMLHIIQQEQENDQGLDGGELGPERRLYYRELIARFGHHLALVWNLGEENTNTYAQRKDFCRYIKLLGPYDHPIVCHTFPGRYDEVYTPLLGYRYFDGPSLQTNDTHKQTITWLDRSASTNRKWFVCLDEIGPAHTGVKPDKDDPEHDEVRKKHLWGHLMAGGAGVEWYFGYKFAHNDLNCEDWRSRENMWDQTRYALEFFRKNLPFTQMIHNDELTTARDDYCFAEPGRVYAIYLPSGGTTKLDMGNYTGSFSVQWYNPRAGGKLQNGSIKEIAGPGLVAIGQPPKENNKDWAVLIKLK
jgi:hypothetical protein